MALQLGFGSILRLPAALRAATSNPAPVCFVRPLPPVHGPRSISRRAHVLLRAALVRRVSLGNTWIEIGHVCKLRKLHEVSSGDVIAEEIAPGGRHT